MKKRILMGTEFLLLALLAGSLAGCLSTTVPVTSPSSSVSSTSSSLSIFTPAAGPRAAKILFKATNPQGSFDPVGSADGTVPKAGSGYPAHRVFNADGSLLAQGGYSSPSWPKWLTSFEVGLSGGVNSASHNPDCARFAVGDEDANTTCDFDRNPDTPGRSCGASQGLFRVSEYDCTRGTGTKDGNGSGNDGVYLRATFSRDPSILNASENILAVLEYTASSLNPPPSNPTQCFKGGFFSPSQPGCSDLNWQIYIKHSSGELVQPFLMLAPPSIYVNTAANSGGSGVSTKQFIIPLGGDPNLTTLQISRIKALNNGGPDSDFGKVCNGANTPANSALCVGMVFYSITFFRI